MDDLESRLVFIDTSAFENKNFQFGQHALKRLENLLDSEQLYLLLTDITVKEIRGHLKEKSDLSAKAIKKIKREAMFLRNTPSLPCYGIFDEVGTEDIFTITNGSFDQFLDNKNIEIICVDCVDPSIVFENYFNARPPFGKADKKSEFPDAFALEAVNKVSRERRSKLYVVSLDGDMKSYSEKNENMIHLEKIETLTHLRDYF